MKNKIKLGVFVLVALIISSCGNTENTPEEKGVTIIEPQKEVIKDYDYYLTRIAEDEEWMGEIEKKAKELGVTVDEELSRNAKYMAKQNGFEEVIKDYNYYIKRISGDSLWMNEIEKQAEEQEIPIDSALSINAIYLTQKD